MPSPLRAGMVEWWFATLGCDLSATRAVSHRVRAVVVFGWNYWDVDPWVGLTRLRRLAAAVFVVAAQDEAELGATVGPGRGPDAAAHSLDEHTTDK